MNSRILSIAIAASGFIAFSQPLLAEGPADAQWAELEKLLKGPEQQPKSREEAMDIFGKHIKVLDEKAQAFLKANPNDARRFKVYANIMQTQGVRGMLNLPKTSDEEVAKMVDETLASKDADAETKGMMSFFRVMNARNDDAKFEALAAAHVKDYPDFRGNRQLDSILKTKAAEKELKTKPLDLKFTSVDGQEVDISKMNGKVVLVDFWATWCGPCVAEVPNVLATYNKLHDKGFEIVGISFDQDKDKLTKFVKDKAMPWPQFFDGKGWKNEFGQRFGINSIPRMWLVNKKGMVVDTNGREDLESKVTKLLAE